MWDCGEVLGRKVEVCGEVGGLADSVPASRVPRVPDKFPVTTSPNPGTSSC